MRELLKGDCATCPREGPRNDGTERDELLGDRAAPEGRRSLFGSASSSCRCDCDISRSQAHIRRRHKGNAPEWKAVELVPDQSCAATHSDSVEETIDRPACLG